VLAASSSIIGLAATLLLCWIPANSPFPSAKERRFKNGIHSNRFVYVSLNPGRWGDEIRWMISLSPLPTASATAASKHDDWDERLAQLETEGGRPAFADPTVLALEPALWRPTSSDTGNQVEVHEFRFGWPFRALTRGSVNWSRRDDDVIYGLRDIQVGNLSFRNPFQQKPYPMILPGRVLWVGFLADLMLFAFASVLVVAIPGLTKRWLRRCRGHCVICGYDLQSAYAAGCPECGDGKLP
jgi:hypothetical protein